ncbi:MAG: DUF6249 domain-containing protein [Caulobacteraceae bacterium]
MEWLTGIFVPLIVFGSIAAIFIVPRYFKSREREQVQQTVRAAIEKGEGLPQEVIESLTRDFKPLSTPMHDIRAGVIWLAIAAGIAILGYTIAWQTDEGDPFPIMLGFAAIPGLVGVVYLVLAAVNKAAKKNA